MTIESTALISAFVTGCVTSLHCVGMCGPIACSFLRSDRGASHAGNVATYQSSRLMSYVILGAVAGALGQSIAAVFINQLAKGLPWAFMTILIVLLFGWEKKFRTPLFLAASYLKITRLPVSNVKARSILLGLGTPFLPCGPLYLMLSGAVISSSALNGALIMLSFGMGTIPLFALLQKQLFKWQHRWSPFFFAKAQKALLIASILVLAWRVVAVGDFTTGKSCCHHSPDLTLSNE